MLGRRDVANQDTMDDNTVWKFGAGITRTEIFFLRLISRPRLIRLLHLKNEHRFASTGSAILTSLLLLKQAGPLSLPVSQTRTGCRATKLH